MCKLIHNHFLIEIVLENEYVLVISNDEICHPLVHEMDFDCHRMEVKVLLKDISILMSIIPHRKSSERTEEVEAKHEKNKFNFIFLK
jgi:hypothetical protein